MYDVVVERYIAIVTPIQSSFFPYRYRFLCGDSQKFLLSLKKILQLNNLYNSKITKIISCQELQQHQVYKRRTHRLR